MSGDALCNHGLPSSPTLLVKISVWMRVAADVRMSLDVVEAEASRDAEALFYVIVHMLVCVALLCHSVVRLACGVVRLMLVFCLHVKYTVGCKKQRDLEP